MFKVIKRKFRTLCAEIEKEIEKENYNKTHQLLSDLHHIRRF